MAHENSPDPVLDAQVDAMLADPRGAFRPRVVAIGDARLAMLVGVGAGGVLSLVTPEALEVGSVVEVEAGDEDPGFVPGRYRVDGGRWGNRPEDSAVPCWINLLAPAADRES